MSKGFYRNILLSKIQNVIAKSSEMQCGKGFYRYSLEIRFLQGFERNIAKIWD